MPNAALNYASHLSMKDCGKRIVVSEFRKRPEFYGLLNLIPSCPCATFSLSFCMRSSPSSGLVNPLDSVPLLPRLCYRPAIPAGPSIPFNVRPGYETSRHFDQNPRIAKWGPAYSGYPLDSQNRIQLGATEETATISPFLELSRNHSTCDLLHITSSLGTRGLKWNSQ